MFKNNREEAVDALNRQLAELNISLTELDDYGILGWFPSEKHRLAHALAQDLGLVR